MRNIYIMTAAILLITGCGKKLETSDIITGLNASQTTVDADGNSVVIFSVELNDRAASDKRSVIFTADAGEWIDGKSGKITVSADYSQGKLVAVAKLKAPSSPGPVNVTAASASLTMNGDFVLRTAVTALNVEAKKIFLEPTSFGMASNFASQDTIFGKITGDNNKNASKGVNVVFEDLLSNGTAAGGRFRQLQIISNSSSMVSAVYSAPQLPLGTAITIRGTILDASGAKTGISHSIQINVNR